jgi:hypothetical protein
MYLEMVEGRKQALRPVIAMDLIAVTPGAKEPGHYVSGWDVKIVNVGNAPALNLTLSVEVLIDNGVVLAGRHVWAVVGAASPIAVQFENVVPNANEAIGSNLNAHLRLAVAPEDTPSHSVHIRLETQYQNSYGLQFKQERVFTLDQHSYMTDWKPESD